MVGKLEKPLFSWFLDLANVTTTPKNNYSWFWRHQDTFKHQRNPQSCSKTLFMEIWESQHLKASACLFHELRNRGSWKLLQFWISETLTLSKFENSKLWNFETLSFIFKSRESLSPRNILTPTLAPAPHLGDTRELGGLPPINPAPPQKNLSSQPFPCQDTAKLLKSFSVVLSHGYSRPDRRACFVVLQPSQAAGHMEYF